MTKVLVEDPVRRSAWLSAQPRDDVRLQRGGDGARGGRAASAARRTCRRRSTRPSASPSRSSDNRRPASAPPRATPRSPCANPALRTEVVPLPVAAKTEDYAPCERFHREGGLSQCDFGVPPEQASRTIALVGDSHASHWRTPLNAVARERGWHGVSITRTSCPFSEATKILPEPTRSQCQDWVAKLPRLLPRAPGDRHDLRRRRSPAGRSTCRPGGRCSRRRSTAFATPGGRCPTASSTSSSSATRRGSPATRSTASTARSPPASAPTSPARSRASRRWRPIRRPSRPARRARRALQVIDLTDRFCSERLCFPVVGGALVFKDLHHFTLVLAETLGPPLAREVDAPVAVLVSAAAPAGSARLSARRLPRSRPRSRRRSSRCGSDSRPRRRAGRRAGRRRRR